MKTLFKSIFAVLVFTSLASASVAQASTILSMSSGKLNIAVANNYNSVTISTPSAWNFTYSGNDTLDSNTLYDYVVSSIYAEFEIKVPITVGFVDTTYDYSDSYDSDNEKELTTDYGMTVSELVESYTGSHTGSSVINVDDDDYALENVDLDYNYVIYPGSGDSFNLYISYITLSGGNLSSLLEGLVDYAEDYAGGAVKADIEGNTIKASVKNVSIVIDTTEVPSSVPVPGAGPLLFAGLMGIAGLKRQKG